jgi:nitroimidazol reductase NimA-like FMN-containing flavoprotein (pyridoxamine 5'-phosphate oxidase superfamily)
MTDEVETGKMTPEMIVALMDRPVIARMATCSIKTHRPHVVPVWFLWDGESIWISSYRSTRKVVDLEGNPYCSIAVDTAESGVDFEAVILEGQAELVTAPQDFVENMTTRIYTRYLGPECSPRIRSPGFTTPKTYSSGSHRRENSPGIPHASSRRWRLSRGTDRPLYNEEALPARP